MTSYRIGVDVGGTNTDAVLMEGRDLIAKTKQPTSEDVTTGILDALKAVIADAPSDATIEAVMLGTTHFTNALLEHYDLSKTAVLRLCLPSTDLLPPLVDWPDDLRRAIGNTHHMVPGGHEFDGQEISPFDESAIVEAVQKMRSSGVEAVAISGVFSTVSYDHELRTADIIKREAPKLAISLSHEIGRVGLLERENAAALNACLTNMARYTVEAIEQALKASGIDAPLFLSQNDGTLMEADFAARYPVLTIASGPTNSMRGAAFLSGIQDGIVVDIGGTSTDVGALVAGFPREASVAVDIANVRTNFRMPDVVSIALGGGSAIDLHNMTIGPASVGYRLKEMGVSFGGDVLTATDVAIAGGLGRVEGAVILADLTFDQLTYCLRMIKSMVEETIDRVKLSQGDVPVILVGGGSMLVPNTLLGASEVVRPEHAEVANAIGAAIAQVGGQIEKVFSLEGMDRREALDSARKEAIEKAIDAGADPKSVEIVEIEEIPLTYLPSNAVRIRAKAVGNLSLSEQ